MKRSIKPPAAGPKKAKIPPSSARFKALSEKIVRLNEWKRKLATLLKFAKKASTTTNLDDLLFLLVEESKILLSAERATVFLVDTKKNELWSRVASNAPTIRVPLGSGIVGAVAKTGQILNIPDVYKDNRFNPEIDKKTGYRTRNALTVPMFNRKYQVIGVFQVLNRSVGSRFDQQDEEILTLIADQASGHVENAQLYEQVRRGAEETTIRLAAAVEYKDKATRAHLWRMSHVSAAIAKHLNFDPDLVETIRLAAPMHDIGKIGVPDAILNKPGKLDAAEWEEMKKHPTFGAEILKDSENELLQMSARVAHCHHEKFDGSGYPRGLKGEDIPIEARIIALADVFDALISKRVYKPSFSLEETLNYIRTESGKHFDPKIVEAFFLALPAIMEIVAEGELKEKSPTKIDATPTPAPQFE